MATNEKKTEEKPKAKRGVGATLDREEAKSRAKVLAAITAWLPNRQAQHGFTGDNCADLDACAAFTVALGDREPWEGADK